jgi:hypothetical protein
LYRAQPSLFLSLCLFIIQDHVVLINVINFLILTSLLRDIYLVSENHHHHYHTAPT